jgi:hypothetical protein
MRNLRISPTVHALAMTFTILIGVLAMPANNLAQEATPGATPEPPTYTVTVLGSVIPVPGAVDEETIVGLKRVDFEAGATIGEEGHPHDGSFVLSVATGAVCYTYINIDVDPNVDVEVKATVASDGPLPAGCESAQTDCAAPDGCVLLPGETVYLTTGSALTQSDTAWHTYGNVDPNNTAVVYLAEFQPPVDAAPCRGGCG